MSSLGLGQGEPFGIEFAPVDAPVDEVRVLPGTVAVSGGVLRGLVRNWSRHLWAYGVTVTVGEQAFEWPSVGSARRGRPVRDRGLGRPD